MMGDTKTTDERVLQRIDFIQALCRNVIRVELDKHLSENRK